MAANVFATMLHRNTNKITMILIYAVLEWVLILLILLNSLFSCFIGKFANYFGLKHPCILCSRVDHVLDRDKNADGIDAKSLCDRHALEISRLGYCRRHQKLVKSQEMCQTCSLAAVSEEETVSKCGCCNERLERKVFPSHLLLKTGWCHVHSVDSIGAKKFDSSLGTEDRTDEGVPDLEDEHQIISDFDSFSNREVTSEEDCSKSLLNFHWHDKEATRDATEAFPMLEAVRESCSSNDNTAKICVVEDSWIEVIDLQLMRHDGPYDAPDRLTMIDMIDSSMSESQKLPDPIEKDQDDSAVETKRESNEPPPAKGKQTGNDEETGDIEASNVIVIDEKDIRLNRELKQFRLQGKSSSVNDNSYKVPNAERLGNAEMHQEKDTNQTINQETEVEEDKFLDTPTSLESLQNWQKKLLLSEKRESSVEESLDGSVLSEAMDGGDGALIVERLKSALTVERKALRALYAEFEEERSASAIATNQTLAMITRLQEEKANMHMEALQYQRMMEEQAEYDQEALQMLNELMLKRESEKQELEKELEAYREKVSEYEAKERLRLESPVKDAEDDKLSTDLNHELIDKNDNDEMNTPSNSVVDLEELAFDCVKNMGELDDSLAEFEEERISILEQLKSLEEKLIMMSNEGEEAVQLRDTDTENEILTFREDGTMSTMVKRLLPLLDEADDNEVGIMTQSCIMADIQVPESEREEGDRETNRIDIVDEVDRVYERLQAFEEDREFLKHCMSSVKKGDEGMDLLQEILQHLRDLKSAELRDRDIEEGE